MTDIHRFRHGDRIRYTTTDDDGFPLVRYGFVGGVADEGGPVVVMLDGELGGDVVDLDTIEPVNICNVTLKLDGGGLLDDPTLRSGLVNLWQAEAEDAGLQIAAIHPLETEVGLRDSGGGYALAELTAAGDQYMLRATRCNAEDAILLRAGRPNGWVFQIRPNDPLPHEALHALREIAEERRRAFQIDGGANGADAGGVTSTDAGRMGASGEATAAGEVAGAVVIDGAANT